MSDRQRSAHDLRSLEQAGQPVFTVAAMRVVDRLAVERFGIPSIVLMENAARSIAAVVEARLMPGASVICCGPGNNGGDGYALARHLHNAGWEVLIVATTTLDELSGDACTNAKVALRMGLPTTVATPPNQADVLQGFEGADLIVDALFGTGLSRPPAGSMAALIDVINSQRLRANPRPLVLSVDLPSGLNGDTGRPIDVSGRTCVKADLTVTLGGLKQGLLEVHSSEFAGTVIVGDIGVPRELLEDHASGSTKPPGSG